MAGDKQEAPWPVPKFFFSVTFEDGGEIAFQEVSGLDTEYEPIEYRDGNSVSFSTVKMPGLRKPSDVTLKKGMFAGDKKLFTHFASVVMNTIKRQTVTISLMDSDKSALFTWKLKNAWPMKYTGTDLNSQNSEVAIEELVLAHEELTME
jgi:phage tail-like protein